MTTAVPTTLRLAAAALIGAGRRPTEAAAAFGSTETTARATLKVKVTFAMLGVRRHADLAQIVTRLQMG